MKMMCVKTVEVQGRVVFREGNEYKFKKTEHMGVAAYTVTGEGGAGVVSKNDPTMKNFVKKNDYEKSVELYKKLNESKDVGVPVSNTEIDTWTDGDFPGVKVRTKTIQEEAKEYLKELLCETENKYHNLDYNFHINEQKRIVTCFVKGKYSNEKYNHLTKLAICHPNDEFNETIGKVIALSRSLGKDVPEKFLNI